MVGLAWTHLPAMVGERVGVDAAFRVTGEENVNEIIVFAGTFSWPAAGVVDLREKVFFGPPDPDPCPALLDAVGEPEFPGDDELLVKYTTAAMTTMAPTRSTHGRRRNGLPDLDSRTFIPSARIKSVADPDPTLLSVKVHSARDASPPPKFQAEYRAPIGAANVATG